MSLDPLRKIFSSNLDMGSVVKCVIKKPNGEEIFIKKEGEDMTDYEVIDKIIDGNYYFEDIFIVYV